MQATIQSTIAKENRSKISMSRARPQIRAPPNGQGQGRKTRIAELNEFAMLFMDMFKREVQKEIEPLKAQITSQSDEIASLGDRIASQ